MIGKTTDLFGSGPVLPVPNVAKAVSFYQEMLGFQLDFVMGDPPDHGSVTRCRVGIQFTFITTDFIPRTYPGWTYIFVTNIDKLSEESASKHVTITQPLGDREHGMREIEIEDLNGYRLRFGQYLDS